VADTLRNSGLQDTGGINAILWTVLKESAGNPRSRVPDQPRYRGEAHFAHGLYQEGGDEWNRYARWLGGRDWRDPGLQTQFLAENIRVRYPALWAKLNDPNRSTEQKAVDFTTDYLKPATRFQNQRRIEASRGIPNLIPEVTNFGTTAA
jgi:hypothetical protein